MVYLLSIYDLTPAVGATKLHAQLTIYQNSQESSMFLCLFLPFEEYLRGMSTLHTFPFQYLQTHFWSPLSALQLIGLRIGHSPLLHPHVTMLLAALHYPTPRLARTLRCCSSSLALRAASSSASIRFRSASLCFFSAICCCSMAGEVDRVAGGQGRWARGVWLIQRLREARVLNRFNLNCVHLLALRF